MGDSNLQISTKNLENSSGTVEQRDGPTGGVGDRVGHLWAAVGGGLGVGVDLDSLELLG